MRSDEPKVPRVVISFRATEEFRHTVKVYCVHNNLSLDKFFTDLAKNFLEGLKPVESELAVMPASHHDDKKAIAEEDDPFKDMCLE